MAFDISQTRGCICYDNKMMPATISSISADGSSTGTAGFPVSNLAYDDTTMIYKTGTSASNRTIDITFTSGVQVNCLGFAGHTLITGGYTLTLRAWNGADFNTIIATQAMTGTSDPNFFCRFPTTTATTWRIELGLPSGTRPAFQIGLLFFGRFLEFEKNPTDGGVFYSQTIDAEPLPALGGTLYWRPGPVRVTEHAELSFPRVPASMMLFLQGTIMAQNAGKVLGLIWPEQVSFFQPNGTQHLFGKLESLVPGPRMSGGAPPHVYDLTLTMKGLS